MKLDICGRFYVLDVRVNSVCYWSKGLDLEASARKVGALAPYETVKFL